MTHSKHHKRTGGVVKAAEHHAKHNSHHREANKKSLADQGDGYSEEEHQPFHEFAEEVHNGSHMRKGGKCG